MQNHRRKTSFLACDFLFFQLFFSTLLFIIFALSNSQIYNIFVKIILLQRYNFNLWERNLLINSYSFVLSFQYGFCRNAYYHFDKKQTNKNKYFNSSNNLVYATENSAKHFSISKWRFIFARRLVIQNMITMTGITMEKDSRGYIRYARIDLRKHGRNELIEDFLDGIEAVG